MAISPASPEAEAGSPGPDRADWASPRRRISRWVIRVLLLAVALLAFSTPALAATHAVHAPHATHAAAAQAAPAAGLTPAAPLQPGQPGGVCQVPGIGDIGGLVGLCNQGSSGIVGDLNNICQPALPQPEQATGGIDAMVQPPGATVGGQTLYDNYGVAGQFWAAHGLQCSDMTSLIGNNVAGMVFDAAKSIDRVTITVDQSAAGDSILTWLQNAVFSTPVTPLETVVPTPVNVAGRPISAIAATQATTIHSVPSMVRVARLRIRPCQASQIAPRMTTTAR